eukprot:143225-Lingulodinium_polyedra.AAC.1
MHESARDASVGDAQDAQRATTRRATQTVDRTQHSRSARRAQAKREARDAQSARNAKPHDSANKGKQAQRGVCSLTLG